MNAPSHPPEIPAKSPAPGIAEPYTLASVREWSSSLFSGVRIRINGPFQGDAGELFDAEEIKVTGLFCASADALDTHTFELLMVEEDHSCTRDSQKIARDVVFELNRLAIARGMAQAPAVEVPEIKDEAPPVKWDEARREQRLRMFLEILDADGGHESIDDGSWANAFCEKYEKQSPDTINWAVDRGLINVTFNDLFETSTAHLTKAGRDFLSSAPVTVPCERQGDGPTLREGLEAIADGEGDPVVIARQTLDANPATPPREAVQ